MEFSDYIRAIDRAYSELRGEEQEARFLALGEDCRRDFGEKSGEYASLINELGAFYRGRAEYAKAEEYFRRALAIQESLGRAGGGDYATVVNNLAGALRLQKRFEESELEFLRCLELYRASVGEQHILYAGGLNNLGLLYLDLGETEKAAGVFAQASGVLEGLPDKRYEYAASLINLGNLYLKQRQPGPAAEKLAAAVTLHETELGTDDPHYHTALNSLGYAWEWLGEREKAAEALEKGFRAALALYGEEHPETRALRRHWEEVKKA